MKLPSNAAKTRSGTRAEFLAQAEKLEREARKMLARRRVEDARAEGARAVEPDLHAKEAAREERLRRDARQIRRWLAKHPEDRQGAKGTIRQSNRTDNESAKMATDKGVLQGYCGVAAVDAKHQIIVEAQAHGTGSEQALLVPVVQALGPALAAKTLITADAGYHSEDNLAALDALGVNALIADGGMRARDPRFAGRGKYKVRPDPLYDKTQVKMAKKSTLFAPSDFTYDAQAGTCLCPAGKALYRNGGNCHFNGYVAVKFQGAQRDCVPCALRHRCLRTPATTKTRQVAFFQGKAPGAPERFTDRMRRRIDSEDGRRRYGQRLATVEPVFANIRHNKRLDRFTLRGQSKVDGQWKLFCLVHNIEKLAHFGRCG